MRRLGQLTAELLIILMVGLGTIGLEAPDAKAEYISLLESNADSGTGSEIFLLSYNSFTDLVNNTFAGSTFSQLNVNSAFSVHGLTHDGSQFQVLLESNADAGTGSEIFLLSYNSFTDLVNNTFASSTFSQLNVNSAFSVGGLAYVSSGGNGNGNGNPVPEPSTTMLVLVGLIVLVIYRRVLHHDQQS